MRLAVISDIHGNVRALEAVLKDITTRGVDDIVNLGDWVAGPLWPRETFELLAGLGIPSVRGNHDRWATDRPDDKMPPAPETTFAMPSGMTPGMLWIPNARETSSASSFMV